MAPYLLEGLRFTPTILRRQMTGLPEKALDERQAERFTPRELIAHLADWEPILRARAETAVSSPGSKIEAYDEGDLAVANSYATSDWRERLEVFQREREETVRFYGALSPVEMSAFVLHPERGRLTTYDLAVMMLGHDVYHVEQLSELLHGS
jgi:hypothetical protein